MPKQEQASGSERFDLIRSLPKDLQEEFASVCRIRRYAPGQMVYALGDQAREMFRVLSGEVRLSYLREDGKELFHTRYRPGDCFGMLSLIDGEPRPQMAESFGDSELQLLPLNEFRRLRETAPPFDKALLLLLSRDIRHLIERVHSARLEHLPSRIARCLVEGAVRAPNGEWQSNIAQARLAAMVDTSRQTVSKILHRFEQRGLIVIKYGAIRIVDLNALSESIEDI
jgi:CRP/FNR family transcriptional regulator, cyclic AMP receptor protein